MTTFGLPPLFDDLEDKAGGDKPEVVAEHTGAMIALRPRQDHIDRLALADGEAPEELHTTILFLGKAADYGYDIRERIITAMREVALRHRFVTGNGFGVNSWNAHGESPCIVLGVGGEELVSIYNSIIAALTGFDLLQMPKQHEPWSPHICLKYTDDFSEVPELVDLQGEVVYDAIRVAFGGIVDDIVLQPALAQNDGNASPNRYANISNGETKGDLGRCRYCKGHATKKVGIDGGAWIGTCDDEDHQSRARKDAGDIKQLDDFLAGEMRTVRVPLPEFPILEEKAVRRVRTAAGVRRYGKPVGSVITSDGSVLKHVKTEESEYDGYEKYSVNGKPFWTKKEGSEYVAYDENDEVVGRGKSEEDILKRWDSITESGSKPGAGKGTTEDPKKQTYSNFKKVDSEYAGFVQYSTPGGDIWRDPKTNQFYDKDDNVLSPTDLSRMNRGGEQGDAESGTTPKTQTTAGAPYGFKKEESEYDGYDKFVAGDGTPVYRDQETLTYYDENDKKLSSAAMHRLGKTAPVQTEKGGTVTREEAGKVMNGAGKKPMMDKESESTDEVDDGEGERSDEVDEKPAPKSADKPVKSESQGDSSARTARMNQRGQESVNKYNEEQRQGAAQPQQAEGDFRSSLPGKVDASDELDAALDKVNRTKGKKVPSDVIKEIRDLAHRQRDIRNKRKLMLYAMQLSEIKAFTSLCEMDPWLRAVSLETKLITPGGRVGSDASLASSPKRNWVENTGRGRLPKYIRIVANGIKGPKSRAIALAVAAMKRWARGGNNVTPKVQAAAAKALAEWEALKAAA